MTLYAAMEPLLVVCPGCGSIVETVARRREPASGALVLTWPAPAPLSCCGALERPADAAVAKANDREARRVRARRAS